MVRLLNKGQFMLVQWFFYMVIILFISVTLLLTYTYFTADLRIKFSDTPDTLVLNFESRRFFSGCFSEKPFQVKSNLFNQENMLECFPQGREDTPGYKVEILNSDGETIKSVQSQGYFSEGGFEDLISRKISYDDELGYTMVVRRHK